MSRYAILNSLKEWGYKVFETEGIDIVLENGMTIEDMPLQHNVVIDMPVYQAKDEDSYLQLLEAANMLNDGFFVCISFYASEDWMEVTATATLDYPRLHEFDFKLRKALLTLERLPEAFELALELVRPGEPVDVKPIWEEDDVVDCREEYQKYFGSAYENVSCGHRLTPEIIRRNLLPAMLELVGRNS